MAGTGALYGAMRARCLSAVVCLIAVACAPGTNSGVKPPTPAGLAATPGESRVDLHWNAVAVAGTTLKAYHVFYGLSATALNQTVAVDPKSTTYSVVGLADQTTYFFAVDSEDTSSRHSDPSAAVTAVPHGPDGTPPTLTASLPGDKTKDVALDAFLQLTFSEPIDVGSLAVALSPPVTLLEPVWDDAHRVVTLNASHTWSAHTTYSVSVVAKDEAGNALVGNVSFSFDTLNPPDTTRPTVESTSPSNGAAAAPVGTSVAVLFSEPMNTALTAAAVTLTGGGACTFSWDGTNRLLACAHAPFSPNTPYTLTVGTGAKDLAGNGLESAVVTTFTTASAPDDTPPTVVSTVPDANSNAISRGTNVTVTLSEPMSLLVTQQAFSCVAGSPSHPVLGTYAWNQAGTEMTFLPAAPFAYGETVQFQLGTGAQDLAGNGLTKIEKRSFKIIQLGNIRLSAQNVNNGSVSSGPSVFDPESKGDPAAWAWAGERYLTGGTPTDHYYRDFLSFDLASLPANAQVKNATLYVYQESAAGDPFVTYGGPLYAQSVDYGPDLDISDLATPVLPTPCGTAPCTVPLEAALSFSTDTGWKTASAGVKVEDDWAQKASRGARSQFRLAFHGDTTLRTADHYVALNVFSVVGLDPHRPRLDIDYEYP